MNETLLGIDYGTVRVGCALKKAGDAVIIPYGQFPNNRQLFNVLEQIIQEERVDRVVVGLPLALDGGESRMTKRVRAFAVKIAKQVQKPVELIDERFTTAAAELNSMSPVSVDERAAQLILETYVERNKHL